MSLSKMGWTWVPCASGSAMVTSRIKSTATNDNVRRQCRTARKFTGLDMDRPGSRVTKRYQACHYGIGRNFGGPQVIAEKLHATVVLDIRNSRMKDFYDIWFLALSKSFALADLSAAITATFERRRTPVPGALPFALTPLSSRMPARFCNGRGSFADYNSTRKHPHSAQWARRSGSSSDPCSLLPVRNERGGPVGLGSKP